MDSLLDDVRTAVDRAGVSGLSPRLRLRSRPAGEADVRVFPGRALSERERQRLSQAVVTAGAGTVGWEGHVLALRLADELVEELGRRLVAGDATAVTPPPVLAGRNYAVQFLDPNACKGLHLGHLYDSVLGHAIASMLAQAGATVRRHNFVCDIGRNVCEALAGHIHLHGDQKPEECGVKPDHFVGRGYTWFVDAHRAGRSVPVGDDPIGREGAVVGDRADDLLRRWRAGDPEVRAMWEQVRNWVVAGHEQTLDRLGITFDRYLWASSVLPEADRIIEEGLCSGLFNLGKGGSVVYRSGRRDYGTFVIRRGDGFPTEHGRQIGLMEQLQDEVEALDGYITIEGEEWKPSCVLIREIRLARGRCRYHEKAHRIHHGMVRLSGATMTSSVGGAILADDVLDGLATAPPAQELRRRYGGVCDPDVIAAIVATTFLLSRPLHKPIDASWDLLLTARGNPGWAAAAAWCRSAAATGQSCPVYPRDGRQRMAIVQAQGVSRALADGAVGVDLAPATDTLRRLADLSVDGAPAPLLRVPLAACLAAVGARTA